MEQGTNISKEGFLKGLTLLDALTLVAGTMIGSGIFIVSADMARTVGSPGLLLIVWAVTAMMTVIGALSYAELTAALPRAGGQYVFLREAFGELPAFLYGWALFLVIGTGITAAVSVAFAKFLGVFLPAVSADNILVSVGKVSVSTQQLAAMAVIAVLTLINCRGVKNGAMVQNLFTFLKTFAVVVLIAAGMSIGRDPRAMDLNFSAMFAGSPAGFDVLTAMGAAMVGSLFSADAWSYVCFAAAEVENPRKNLPRALLIGTLAVGALYILINLAYLSVLPLVGSPNGADIVARGIQYASEDRVATAVAQSILGSAGLYIVAGAIMISTFGCANGNILTCARAYYAMAKDGMFFRSLAKIDGKTHVPVMALFAGGLWSCLLTLTGSYGQLLDYIIFTTLLFYALTISALFVLRKKQPDLHRPYRTWGYPYLPMIYIVLAVLICVDLLIFKPSYSWPGLIIVLAGVPVYFIKRRAIKR